MAIEDHATLSEKGKQTMEGADGREEGAPERRGPMSVGSAVLKLCVVLGVASLSEIVFSSHAKYAFSVGLMLGAIVQHFIPPRVNPKMFALFLLLTFVFAVIRAVL